MPQSFPFAFWISGQNAYASLFFSKSPEFSAGLFFGSRPWEFCIE